MNGLLQSLEILLIAVGFYTRCIGPVIKRVQIVATEAPRKETACQTRPGEKRHIVLLIPFAGCLSLCPADTDAAFPGWLDLIGETEIGAADNERCQFVLRCILVGFLNALMSPI